MKKVDAAIITALPKELHAVLDQLDRFRRVDGPDGRTYYEAETEGGCDIVATSMTSMGATDAALVTNKLLAQYEPGRLLLTGIAGALSDDVALGDIVVAEQVVDYELAKIRDEEVETRWSVYRNDPILLHRAKQWIGNEWMSDIVAPPPSSAPLGFEPRIHFGVVMSGNKVVANRAVARNLLSFWRRALAVEMEGAGVGAALYHHDAAIPFTLIKGVCDRADSRKNDDWQAYAASASAAYALDLLVDAVGTADMPQRVPAADLQLVPSTTISRYSLRVLMANSYDMAELRTLCFDLDVDWDELAGRTKTEKIVSLYLHCKRKGKLQELLAAVDRDTNGGVSKYAAP
ncbi:MAG: 5'-methylthioadenosine/S-adenosylhomocysteine nucleosidase [Gammaproteobacteria bacterium]|nr:5'-methylthioadenosine/S-adenosylhomocysteine nucleosidase [Gammaproteobacteria bacterium]MDH3467858.1 5'-methylthioadenosine/S-adenosylhomocysteine nucleosidase [Gammaproteobacteria bacterium]